MDFVFSGRPRAANAVLDTPPRPLAASPGALRRALLALTLALMPAGCGLAPFETPPTRAAAALPDLPPARRFAPARPAAPARSNRDIARDFLDLHFQLEGGSTLPVFTRFEGPVTVQLTGAPPPGMAADLDALILRLRQEAGIGISRTGSSGANIVIEAVPHAAIRRALPNAACFVVPNTASLEEYRRTRRTARTSWTALRSRDQLAVFIPNDASPQEVRDCLHEELAQALAPLNDLYRLPDSIFNDDNAHVVLTGFDMLVLRAAYAPELQTGMSRADVAARLPALLARLNPATPPAWSRAIETALIPGTAQAARLRAASEATRMARDLGWQDHRRGFAHYTLGQLLQPSDPQAAADHFNAALKYMENTPGSGPQKARIQSRLAGLDLSAGRPEDALRRTAPAMDQARAAQNAAVLARLQLQSAEALARLGRSAQARAVRLDSLGWARYGFGSEWAGRAQQQMAVLGPQTTQAKTR